MPKDIFQFPCPCCGKRVEVNVRSGRARAVKPEEAKGRGDLDTMIDKHKHEGDRLAGLFEDALDQQARQTEHLDELLEQAKEDAKKDEDERPRNPFDLE